MEPTLVSINLTQYDMYCIKDIKYMQPNDLHSDIHH